VCEALGKNFPVHGKRLVNAMAQKWKSSTIFSTDSLKRLKCSEIFA